MKMNNVIKTPLLVTCFLLGVSGNSIGADATPNRCKTYSWKPGDIIQIDAQMFKQTHITLPEEALDVIWGTKELWQQDFVKNHVFLQPTTKEPEGAETTVTAIGNSGNAYEFNVTRVKGMVSHCIMIKTNGDFIRKGNWDTKDSEQDAKVAVLQQQLARVSVEAAQANAQATAEGKRIAQAAVKTYRATLFSNYDWTAGAGWFATSAVESVQDDGRFTYIRLKSDSRGIMSVLAEIDGTPEVLEKSYDAAKREYKIAGIYPKFILRAGDSEVTITRRGNNG